MTESPLIFKRAPAVVAAAVGDKSLLLHVEKWVYLELNESGSRIWELLDGERPFSGVAEELIREFKVDPKLCLSDTSEFITELEARNFIVREDQPT